MVEPGCRRQGIGYDLTLQRLKWIFESSDIAWYFANAENSASIALHASVGFEEITRDFQYPGVTFAGGVGILCQLDKGKFCLSRLSKSRTPEG